MLFAAKNVLVSLLGDKWQQWHETTFLQHHYVFMSYFIITPPTMSLLVLSVQLLWYWLFQQFRCLWFFWCSHGRNHFCLEVAGIVDITVLSLNEPQHDKIHRMTCVPIEDSDKPGHSPSLIRVFAMHFMGSLGPKLSSGGQQRLWSDWADAQADLSLCSCTNHFFGFVVHWIKV